MWFLTKMLCLSVVAFNFLVNGCLAISNTNFNSNIRDFSTDDVSNATQVKTLQKVESKNYSNFVPIVKPNQIKFKETPDSALSSSSHNRGYHEHPGYHFTDYEDAPHLAYGNDFHIHDPHGEVHGPHSYEHGYHEYDHHVPHHPIGHHHFNHGHYKYDKHALVSKALLLPIAGIALLGAAAALVNNPILLQLGVVSGKRRRRDTEEVTGPDYTPDMLKKYKENFAKEVELKNFKNKRTDATQAENIIGRIKYLNNPNLKRTLKTKNYRNGKYWSRINGSLDKTVDNPVTSSSMHFNSNEDDLFIPIPIQLKP